MCSPGLPVAPAGAALQLVAPSSSNALSRSAAAAGPVSEGVSEPSLRLHWEALLGPRNSLVGGVGARGEEAA